MIRQTRLALYTTTLLIAVVFVTSCATAPYEPSASLPPPPRESSAAVEEEIWVIAKATHAEGAIEEVVVTSAPRAQGFLEQPGFGPVDDLSEPEVQEIGTGAMVATFGPDNPIRNIRLPLQHTAVDAAIAGYIGTVKVNQQFANPFDTKIEAVYYFPLPEKAAVSEFLMIIGDRTIRGILREKEEAEAIYRQARAQGYRASLLVQRRPNVFEQKVANIEPGKSIDVDITYFHTLAYKDGWYSFVFPTVVGPRYNPSGHPDPIAALPRGGHGKLPGVTGVEYLTPGERSGHDLGITVRIDAGVEIEELKSTHRIDVTRQGPESATVRLADGATIPNQDFVLDFRVAGDTVKSKLLTHRNAETGAGFFTLMVIPPIDTAPIARRPMEMVFVLDCSGSMAGRPLEQAKEAVIAALGRLNANDTFQIIRFSDAASQFGAAPVAASEQNLAAARSYLDSLSGDGSTEMLAGIEAALGSPHSPSHYRFVSFMTDGYIGNETDILAAVHRHIGTARIFSFGVGTSVNRYLLQRMAGEGRGVAAYLGLNDSAEEVMAAFFERASRPALTDIEIDWGGMTVSDTFPARLPDLYVGRPLVVSGRFQGRPTSLTVSGAAGDARRSMVMHAAEATTAGPFIAKVWARLNIADLADRQATTGDPGGELADAIRRTALQHQLASNYTSFVAVDSSEPTKGEYGVTVHQAVPVPAGVRYDTTVE